MVLRNTRPSLGWVLKACFGHVGALLAQQQNSCFGSVLPRLFSFWFCLEKSVLVEFGLSFVALNTPNLPTVLASLPMLLCIMYTDCFLYISLPCCYWGMVLNLTAPQIPAHQPRQPEVINPISLRTTWGGHDLPNQMQMWHTRTIWGGHYNFANVRYNGKLL